MAHDLKPNSQVCIKRKPCLGKWPNRLIAQCSSPSCSAYSVVTTRLRHLESSAIPMTLKAAVTVRFPGAGRVPIITRWTRGQVLRENTGAKAFTLRVNQRGRGDMVKSDRGQQRAVAPNNGQSRA